MTTATVTAAPTGPPRPPRAGDAIRAIKVFASTALTVAVLGTDDPELYRKAGVVRRHH
ncbi:hypothetical protein [Streptomyces beihaiensis]|uniref:Uncharacterized protein n=1 Tax=Streptomyces beihaiensis TaxID=2984495 RepID=A0ABT3TXM8_9ACTN|nr:hypothetical protein [Streptomyces beihaiensis]MCX3060820.1 hypothetical protein [Streptomyces beihaiensis]